MVVTKAVVTKALATTTATNIARLLCVLSLWPALLQAAVLPEDRSDVLYHSYSGDDVTIDGPSILVRKGYKEKVSFSANYYVDNVSSASIDVRLSASKYTEKREEKSLGVDILQDKTLLTVGFTRSEENDYFAESWNFNVSQDFFGDLTTLSLGYSRGDDVVKRNDDAGTNEDVDRQHFRFGVTQVLTRNALLSLNYEAITDEGFLNNPYRQVRYIDPLDASNFRLEPEVYPRTRTSDAISVGVLYYLPYRAALKLRGRYFSDDWGIDAASVELGYTHPIKERWELEFKYRYYQQSSADFYSDLFPRIDFQNFRARDKELSTFNTHSIGMGVKYQWQFDDEGFFNKASVNLSLDYMRFDYEDFRDATVSQNDATIAAGDEPFFNFGATVVRLYFSVFY